MRRLTVGLIAALVLAVGCERPAPATGVVMRKIHRSTQVVMVGKVPFTMPETWELVIQREGTRGEDEQYCVDLSETDWNALGVGDLWRRTR